MKKQNLINLVKYHVEKKEEAFVNEVAEIAREFDANGDESIAQYLMDLISNASFYVPQSNYKNLKYLRKISYSTKPLILPDVIEEEIIGITRAINKKMGMNKFLFQGSPGTGKTESAYQIARLLNRDILSVDFEQLIDSRLGETGKNVARLFDEINHLPYGNVLVVFDEIDSLVMNRINGNDLREMGRVTSVFLRELDDLNENVVLIATTNLFDEFDKALIRRFDATISFDRYKREDLIKIADAMLIANLKKSMHSKQDIRLFNKILNNQSTLPNPGELKQIIKTAVAFSDDSSEYDYLRKIYCALNDGGGDMQLQQLSKEGYTVREMEILTRIPRSSISRKLKEE